MQQVIRGALGGVLLVACSVCSHAQVPPSAVERAGYTGLLAAAAGGDVGQIKSLTAKGERVDVRDGHGRTPLHVAAFLGRHDAMRALVAAGADPNALESDRYDIATIAAVANDVPTLRVALSLGASAKNITSRYDGTALIAASHLGHAEVVRTLITAGAPLDHVNNLAGRHSSNPSTWVMVARVTRKRCASWSRRERMQTWRIEPGRRRFHSRGRAGMRRWSRYSRLRGRGDTQRCPGRRPRGVAGGAARSPYRDEMPPSMTSSLPVM